MIAKVLFVGFALLAIAYASCPTCGNLGSGTDVCGCSINVVRPVKQPRIQPAQPRIVCAKVPGVEKFRPIGDVCSCGNSIVSPAYTPKQRCSSCQARIQQYPYALGSPLLPAPASLNNFEAEETGGEYDYLNSAYGSSSYGAETQRYNDIYSPQQPLAPADAVSLTLAYGLQQQAAKSVPEERLAFGFRQIPKDAPAQKQANDIPEERLVTVDRQIVELQSVPRPYGCGAGSRLEQEAAEDLLRLQQDELEQQDEGSQAGQAYLSYSDIGYRPEQPRNQPQFYVNRAQPAIYDDIVSTRINCNDGYIPGNVINRNTALEYLEESDVSSAYDDEDGSDIAYGGAIRGFSGSNYGPNSFAANAGNSNILLQKLGARSGGCGCGL